MYGLPAKLDLQIVRGDTFKRQFQLVACDQLDAPTEIGVINGPTTINGVTYIPVDLTNSVVQSQIRRDTSAKARLVVAFTVTIDDALNGLYTLSLTPEQTTLVGASDIETNSYDTQIINDGVTTTHVYGDLNVFLDVTK